MSISKFLQNTEEITEEDDGVKVTSQTNAIEEVGVEEPIVFIVVVDMHESRGECNDVVEGEVEYILQNQ